jgi:hypothetical protein
MRGLLFSQMEPAPALRREFDDWYDHEHIPARLALPGFASAARYEADEGEPSHLACYFLDDVAVLDSPEYLRLKAAPSARTERMLGSVSGFTRYLCDELFDIGPAEERPGALSVVAFSVPAVDRAEFAAWYEEEHVPMLMRADGWLRVRQYEPRPGFDGPAWTHLTLHELRDVQVMDSDERKAARATPRRAALAERHWFGRSGRWLYRPVALHNPVEA